MELKNKYTIEEKEKCIIKMYGEMFYFWNSFEQIDLLLTPIDHISDKFSLSILARAWIHALVHRNTFRIGAFNNQILYPYLDFNLFFNKKKAIKETFKIYAKVLGFVILNVLYVSMIVYYDSFLYEYFMTDEFVYKHIRGK